MRKIEYIVIHCTGTRTETSVASILKYWRETKGWENPGYHFLISHRNSNIHQLIPINEIANGAIGHNHNSIHIAYIGGLDANGEYNDTRTDATKHKMMDLIRKAKARWPNAVVLGHRDLPDVHKECPCFDVQKWIEEYDNTFL